MANESVYLVFRDHAIEGARLALVFLARHGVPMRFDCLVFLSISFLR